jgi:hypothetical protein
MYRMIITCLSLLVVASTANAVGVGDAAEVEAARANARAGGPVSERDAELLERYGFRNDKRTRHEHARHKNCYDWNGRCSGQ